MQHDQQDRIDQLASQVRRLRWMNYGMAAVLAAGAMLAAGGLQQVSPLVKAKRVEIVSDDGKTLLALGSDPEGGMLEVFNASGEKVASMESLQPIGGTGAITTYDGKGQELVALGVTKGGTGAITTFDGKGQELVTLAATEGGAGGIAIFNGKGQRLVALGATAGGEGSLAIFDGKGQRLVKLSATEDGGLLGIFNGEGRPVVALGVTKGGNGFVSTKNSAGQIIGTLP